MLRRRYLPLLAVVLFCLTSMAGFPNQEPGGQLTVVKGNVINLRTGRPLAGARMAIFPAENSRLQYSDVGDTVHTNARGAYTLSFTNKKGLFYAIDCGQLKVNLLDYYWQPRLDFPDSLVGTAGNFLLVETKDLVLGQTNIVNFRPSPRRVWQVQVNMLTTSYQNLCLAQQYFSTPSGPADNQHRLVIIYQSVPFTTAAPQKFYQTPSVRPTTHFIRPGPGTTQDTLVQLVPITTLTGDTVEATLKFGH